MAVQFLVPAQDLAGDFTSSAMPNVWFGNGSGGQILTNLYTYIRENSGSGNNTASYMDGNVVLTPTNATPVSGTAVYVTHLSSGSAPAGNAIATYYQTFYNDTAPASQWIIELRQHYLHEASQGILLGSYDATLQTSGSGAASPSGTISASFFPPGGTDYTDLSIRIVEGIISGSRTWIGWIKLEVDSIPPQSKIWLGQAPISGAFTGAFQGDGSQLINISSSISSSFAGNSTTSSYALTASAANNFAGQSGSWQHSLIQSSSTGGALQLESDGAGQTHIRFGANGKIEGQSSQLQVNSSLPISISGSGVFVGADPGGVDTLRVSGTFNVGGTNFITAATGSLSNKAFGEFVPQVTWSSATASGVKPNGTIWIQY